MLPETNEAAVVNAVEYVLPNDATAIKNLGT
jgi:hypothetical protein